MSNVKKTSLDLTMIEMGGLLFALTHVLEHVLENYADPNGAIESIKVLNDLVYENYERLEHRISLSFE